MFLVILKMMCSFSCWSFNQRSNADRVLLQLSLFSFSFFWLRKLGFSLLIFQKIVVEIDSSGFQSFDLQSTVLESGITQENLLLWQYYDHWWRLQLLLNEIICIHKSIIWCNLSHWLQTLFICFFRMYLLIFWPIICHFF